MKVVFASTRQLYGRPQYLPVDERHPVAPVDPNGVNKAAGEGYHLVYGRVYGLRTSRAPADEHLRAADAREGRPADVPRHLAAARGRGRGAGVFGDGSQRRDFTYVDDAVDAFLLAGPAREADGEVFNLGGDPSRPTSLS